MGGQDPPRAAVVLVVTVERLEAHFVAEETLVRRTVASRAAKMSASMALPAVAKSAAVFGSTAVVTVSVSVVVDVSVFPFSVAVVVTPVCYIVVCAFQMTVASP